jgi:hypothetical protein
MGTSKPRAAPLPVGLQGRSLSPGERHAGWHSSGTVSRGLASLFQNDEPPLEKSMRVCYPFFVYGHRERARGQTWEPAAAPARTDAMCPGATCRDTRWLPGRAEQLAMRVWVYMVRCTRARTTSLDDHAYDLSQV